MRHSVVRAVRWTVKQIVLFVVCFVVTVTAITALQWAVA